MNRGHRREASICEWDDVKQQNPNFAEDMEIIEKFSKIGNINAVSSEEIAAALKKINERLGENINE